jgi:hypothetical protein
MSGLDCADVDTMSCDGPVDAKKCVRAADKGESCTTTFCKNGLWCWNSICTDTAFGSLGDDCHSLPCSAQQKLICDADATFKCRPVNYIASGKACQALDDCVGAGYCLNTSGTCPQIAPDGATCNSGARCIPPARCFNGKCTFLDPTRCSATPSDAGGDR